MEPNPFNILNVYADCSAKELAASKAKLTAFTSVGKVGHSCISPWQYNHVIQRS